MGLPVAEHRIQEAERELGRALPAPLRERLLRDNGGEIEVSGYPGDNPYWQLHSVWDPTDRKTASRSATHLVHETREAIAVERLGLPEGTVVIAGNGTGDLLVLPPGDDRPHWWDHETDALEPVTVDWS